MHRLFLLLMSRNMIYFIIRIHDLAINFGRYSVRCLWCTTYDPMESRKEHPMAIIPLLKWRKPYELHQFSIIKHFFAFRLKLFAWPSSMLANQYTFNQYSLLATRYRLDFQFFSIFHIFLFNEFKLEYCMLFINDKWYWIEFFTFASFTINFVNNQQRSDRAMYLTHTKS